MELIKTNTLNFYFEPAKSELKKGSIVFIHGLDASSHYFFLINQSLLEYDCYFVGLPAHGLTPVNSKKELNIPAFAELFINWINEIDLKEFYLLGHSLGAGVASLVGFIVPQRVQKLILVCPYHYQYLNSFLNKKLFNAWVLFPNPFLKFKTDVILKKLYIDYRNNYKTLPETRWDSISREYPRVARDISLLCLSLLNIKFNHELKMAQRNLIMPTLVMVSKQDELIDYRLALKVFRNNSQISTYIFNNSGHIPFIEEPKLFTNILLSFLEDRFIEQEESESNDVNEK